MISMRLLFAMLFICSMCRGDGFADVECEPSTLIEGCVNAITGNYITSRVDLVVGQIQPIRLIRNYATPIKHKLPKSIVRWHKHAAGWSLLDFVVAERSDGYAPSIKLCDTNGACLTFIPQAKDKKAWIQSKQALEDGCCNSSRGCISGNHDLANFSIDKACDKSFELLCPDGTKRYYSFQIGRTQSAYFLLDRERHPNGNWTRYQYVKEYKNPKHEDAFSRFAFTRGLKRIETTNASGSCVYSWINITHSSEKTSNVLVETSDGKWIKYKFKSLRKLNKKLWEKMGEPKLNILIQVTSSEFPAQWYGYEEQNSHLGPVLTSSSSPRGRGNKVCYLYQLGLNTSPNNYHNTYLKSPKDKRFGRVQYLHTPWKANGSWGYTHYFVHHPSEMTKGEGSCEVIDAEGCRTEYFYSPKKRLKRIKRYSNDGKVIGTTFFQWNGHRLAKKGLLDADGEIVWERSFQYDERGNPIKESFCGKGLSEAAITERRFSPDGYNLLVYEKKPCGLVTTWRYVKGANLVKSKFVNGNGLRERHFFEYDEDRLVIGEIIDDGKGSKADDLKDVTERRIVRYQRHQQGPHNGLPYRISTYYLDISSTQEVALVSRELTYNARGQVVEEHVEDMQSGVSHVSFYEYDDRGRLTKNTNPLGQSEIHQYDDKIGLKVKTVDVGDNVHKYTYDHCNRLAARSKLTPEGNSREEFIKYNSQGDITEEIDHFGNSHHFKYDSPNRCICEESPVYAIRNGSETKDWTKREYDAAGNVTRVLHANGRETYTDYNAFGKPITIRHADGARESYEYDLDGNVVAHIDPQDIKTIYERDCRGRKTRKVVLDGSGNVLKEEQWVFSAFHLVKHIDAGGYVTTYEYDGCGRKIAEVRGATKQSYKYDGLGRLKQTVQHNGDASSVEIFKHDLLGRIVENRVEGLDGTVYSKVCYGHDAHGNQTLLKRYQANDRYSTDLIVYDGFGRETLHTDAEGHNTRTEYDEHHHDGLGQRVLKKTVTNPLGRKTVEIFDTLGNVRQEQRLVDSNEIHSELFDRLPSGEVIEQRSTIHNPDGTTRVSATRWEYDRRFRPIKLVEAVGSNLERITLRQYSPRGHLIKVTKPDGTRLSYDYDGLGHLRELKSSDRSVHYSYEYDCLGQLLHCKDHVGNRSTLRHWDMHGNLTEETLGNGLNLKYRYDAAGRRIGITYPDGKSVVYGYDPLHIRHVTYCDTEGAALYSHRYTEIDWDGHVLAQTSTNSLGNAQYKVDYLGRTVSINHEKVQHEILKFDGGGNVLSAKQMLSSEPVDEFYRYDQYDHIQSESGYSPNDYTYDSHHNRLASMAGKTSINTLNQTIGSPTGKFVYDQNGSPIRKDTLNGTTHYRYDALDRLVEVDDGHEVHTYTYDHLDRRIIAKSRQAGTRSLFFYEDKNDIGSCDENGQIVERRALGIGHGAEIGSSVMVELCGQVLTPIHDLYGNVSALFDQNGEIFAKYEYDAFGVEKHSNRLGTQNPWRYCSKRHDPTGLVYFGRRYYAPELGRFWTPDPKGLNEGPNLYQYVHNNPLLNFDLYGLEGIYYGHPAPSFDWAMNAIASPRMQGSLQVVGGIAEISSGFGASLLSGGLATPLGWFAILHGIDQTLAGLRTASSGQYYDTVSAQLLQKTGLSYHNAQLINDGVSSINILSNAAVLNAAKSNISNLGHCFNRNHFKIERSTKNHQLRFVYDNWDNGTFPNRMQSIRYHLQKHGNGRTAWEYTKDGCNFFNCNRNKAEQLILKNGKIGMRIQTKTVIGNEGGFWTLNGKIITYWDTYGK